MCMSKKKILILIVTISVLFIATVSFLIIKNKTDKMEKFEINNNENNEENNGRHNAEQRSRSKRGRIHRALPLQGGERQRNGLHVIAHQERHRNHVFVPCPHEKEHEQHTDG